MTKLHCGDCGAEEGQVHEWFCEDEKCPFCGNQLVTCGCIRMVLKLTKAEQQALDEYRDDSVDPLKSINQKWKEALTKKGRVPFT